MESIMVRKTNRGSKSQALLELGILSSIFLFLLATLIRFGVTMNARQSLVMRGFRHAVQRASMDDVGSQYLSYAGQYFADIPVPDPNSPTGVADLQEITASAQAIRTYHMNSREIANRTSQPRLQYTMQDKSKPMGFTEMRNPADTDSGGGTNPVTGFTLSGYKTDVRLPYYIARRVPDPFDVFPPGGDGIYWTWIAVIPDVELRSYGGEVETHCEDRTLNNEALLVYTSRTYTHRKINGNNLFSEYYDPIQSAQTMGSPVLVMTVTEKSLLGISVKITDFVTGTPPDSTINLESGLKTDSAGNITHSHVFYLDPLTEYPTQSPPRFDAGGIDPNSSTWKRCDPNQLYDGVKSQPVLAPGYKIWVNPNSTGQFNYGFDANLLKQEGAMYTVIDMRHVGDVRERVEGIEPLIYGKSEVSWNRDFYESYGRIGIFDISHAGTGDIDLSPDAADIQGINEYSLETNVTDITVENVNEGQYHTTRTNVNVTDTIRRRIRTNPQGDLKGKTYEHNTTRTIRDKDRYDWDTRYPEE